MPTDDDDDDFFPAELTPLLRRTTFIRENEQESYRESKPRGSTVKGAVFNLTNSIVAAGAIGLGGAIANSGGLLSIATVLLFAVLSKYSFDMVVSLAVESEGSSPSSYEQLGATAFGYSGQMAVVISKFVYSFGSLVAYSVIIKDNFSPAIHHFIYGTNIASENSGSDTTMLQSFLGNVGLVTFLISAIVVLPLCMLRHMARLEKVSTVKIGAVVGIILIALFMYIDNPNGEVRVQGGTFSENWLQVKPGFVESLGTFVFNFVSQHTVHLTYNSLRSDIRSVKSWEAVSTWTILLAAVLSLTIGIVIYITFWDQTPDDVFEAYPQTKAIDLAKLLLCFVMMFTYPLPFFSCREMIVVFLSTTKSTAIVTGDVESKLLLPADTWWLVDVNQLIFSFHVMLTTLLWVVTTFLAIKAPSLGVVLDLVGCCMGTVIAFILPGLFCLKLKGFSLLAWSFLIIGIVVGLVGTFFSLRELF